MAAHSTGSACTRKPTTTEMILNPKFAGSKPRPTVGLSVEARTARLIEIGKSFGHVDPSMIFCRQNLPHGE